MFAKLGHLYLIPTAESPVANIHREELLKESQLPIRYCAYTPCFRGEAGAAGVGTRGMIRVHQFDKVELIKIVKPENGYDEHGEDAGQRGAGAAVARACITASCCCAPGTWDSPARRPTTSRSGRRGRGSYLEVSSCSNCEDFQARRMNLRFKTDDGENRFPHILNGSGTALARLFVALMETFQQADGSVLVPPALQPYLKADRIAV